MAALAHHRPDIEAICRHCHADLDDGDIYEKLKMMFNLIYNDDEIRRLASLHGWTPENRIRFTRELQVYTEREHYLMCPDCKGYEPLKK